MGDLLTGKDSEEHMKSLRKRFDMKNDGQLIEAFLEFLEERDMFDCNAPKFKGKESYLRNAVKKLLAKQFIEKVYEK